MKKFLTTFILTIFSLISFGCHESHLTLVSGPTDVGGCNYSTIVQVCIGQTVNWGGTRDFTITVNGANIVSYSPATLTNTYNAYTSASCKGPNCFMGGCASVTANAGSSQAGNTVTYNTTSSTPAGFPLVPDDNEECGGNSASFCFNFTFVTDAYPSSVVLAGNTELYRPTICNQVCGQSTTYTAPCNGSYDIGMTLIFSPMPVELLLFTVRNSDNKNFIEWLTASEINNNYFSIERSGDGVTWTEIFTVEGTDRSYTLLMYFCIDSSYKKQINYYRLKQVDNNGNYTYYDMLFVNNSAENKNLLKVLDLWGNEITNPNPKPGIKLHIYDDGSIEKHFY